MCTPHLSTCTISSSNQDFYIYITTLETISHIDITFAHANFKTDLIASTECI